MKIPKIAFIAFDEEDGEIFADEISFDKRSTESQNAFIRADLVRGVVEAAEKMLDAAFSSKPADWAEAHEGLQSALAAWKAMEES